MIVVYGIKNCDKCRQAIKQFSKNASFHDIRENPLDERKIKFLWQKKGDFIVNKKSKTWKNLNENDRKLKIIELVKKFPLILKRPIIEIDGEFSIGLIKEVKTQFDYDS